MKRKQRSKRVAHKISRSVCMVQWRYAWYWSQDSSTPHWHSCSHGTHQAKVETYENRMASKYQRRGHQAIESKVHQICTSSRMDSQCCARTQEKFKNKTWEYLQSSSQFHMVPKISGLSISSCVRWFSFGKVYFLDSVEKNYFLFF